MKFLLSVIIMITGAFSGNAQGDTESFDVEATLVAPISITNVSDLNFGTLAASGTLGTAVFSTSGVLSSTGGVSIAADGAITATPASFTVTGEEDYTYSITLPAPFTIEEAGVGTATMQITLSENTTEILTAGSQTVTLGAILNVAASQTPGTYSGTFNVTVEYN